MNNTFNAYFANSLSSREKLNAIRTLCLLENANQKALNKLNLNEKIKQKSWGISNEAKNEFPTISKLQKTISLLTPTSALIIENDFVKKAKNKDWMEQYFSKTTYYKYRRNAIEEFLYFYLNVN